MMALSSLTLGEGSLFSAALFVFLLFSDTQLKSLCVCIASILFIFILLLYFLFSSLS